jgi:hypothetical protein
MKNRISLLFFISFISTGIGAQSRIQEPGATQYKHSIIINFLISKGSSCTGYQIQRSQDTSHFEAIYDYSGVCGELSKDQAITFADEHPQKNTVNYYRVLIPPSDHSMIISVAYSDISEQGYIIHENPVGDQLQLTSLTKGTLKIYNQTGRLVIEIISNEDGPFTKNVSSLDSGLYYFVIEPAVGRSLAGKFVKK